MSRSTGARVAVLGASLAIVAAMEWAQLTQLLDAPVVRFSKLDQRIDRHTYVAGDGFQYRQLVQTLESTTSSICRLIKASN
uniref:Uncharacterized protein n=1 Tax=Arundo donax TaxID=35708 RepID=A0A0A8YJA8_ARUDO